jgi:hypothetical protein
MKRIGLVACEVLRKEIETLLQDDPSITVIRYLEFGNHVHPKQLKQKVIDTIEEIKDHCDSIIVGFGVCQSLGDLPSCVDIPLVTLDNDDCISILLTKQRYKEELEKETGTYFMTPGWCDRPTDDMFKEFKIQDSALRRGKDPQYFIKLLFKNYKRLLFIDTGVTDKTKYEQTAREVAQMLGLKFEETNGCLTNLKDLLSRAKT